MNSLSCWTIMRLGGIMLFLCGEMPQPLTAYPRIDAPSMPPPRCSGPLNSLQPTAMAFGKDDELYVSEPSTNQILVRHRNGSLSVLASSCKLGGTRGYVDGAASNARFSQPAGLAIGKRGELYIADSGNHVIRVYEHGTVQTYAGSGKVGTRDGSLRIAEFVNPTGVSIDERGSLIVADSGSGLREITQEGQVSSLSLPLRAPFAVAAAGNTLFIADKGGLVVYKRADKALARFSASSPSCEGCLDFQGGRPSGYPFALAAIDDHSLFYSDADTGEVHYADTAYLITRIVLKRESGIVARGMAVRHDGNVAVGSPRGILLMRGFDTSKPFMPIFSALPPSVDIERRQIIPYVGNSFVWWDTDWSDSIPGVIENGINRGTNGRFQVLPIYIPDAKIESAEQYISTLSDVATMPVVLLQIDSSFIASSFSIPSRAVPEKIQIWQHDIVAGIKHLREHLATRNVILIVVIHPEAFELADKSIEQALVPQLISAGICTIDLYPAFQESGTTGELFGVPDRHFNAAGRKLVGSIVGNYLSNLFRRTKEPRCS